MNRHMKVAFILLNQFDKAVDISSWNFISQNFIKIYHWPKFYNVDINVSRFSRLSMIMNSHLSELFFKNAQIIEIDFPLKAYTKMIF